MYMPYSFNNDGEWLTDEGIKGKVINTLRMLSLDSRLENKMVFIPDGCEDMGFLAGDYDIASILHFIADMIE